MSGPLKNIQRTLTTCYDEPMIGGDGNDPHYHSETDQQSAPEQYSPLPVEFLHERFPLLLAANRRGGHFRFGNARFRRPI